MMVHLSSHWSIVPAGYRAKSASLSSTTSTRPPGWVTRTFFFGDPVGRGVLGFLRLIDDSHGP